MRTSAKQKKRRSIVARMLRGIMWTALGLLVLLGIALAMTQTGIFRGWVVGKIETTVNESINGRLHIGELNGNLLTHVELGDISFIVGYDTIAVIDRIRADYSLLPLLSRRIEVDSLIIEGPRLRMAQDSAGVWNITRVVPLESDTVATHSAASPFGYDVFLSSLVLQRGTIRMQSNKRLIPRIVDSLNIALSGSYAADHQTLRLTEFRFRTSEPQFALRRLSFALERKQNTTTMRDFQLQTSENELAATAEYDPADTARSEAEVTSQPIKFSEFAFAMPDLDLIANPSIDLTTYLRKDSLTISLEITQAKQSIVINGYLANLSTLFDTAATAPPRYGAAINLRDVDPVDWVSKPPIGFHISGDIDVRGSGRELKNIEGTVSARLHDCVIDKRPVTDFSINAQYTQGNATGSLDVNADFGKITATGSVDDLFGHPHTVASGTLSSLNLAEMLRSDSLRSNLNSTFRIDVTGKDLATFTGNAAFNMSKSSFAEISVDTLETVFDFADGEAHIDTVFTTTEAFELKGKGSLDTTMYFDGNLAITLEDLSEFASFARADSLRGSGTISGAVKGRVDSFECDLAADLTKLSYNAVTVGHVVGQVKGRVDSTGYTLDGSVMSRDIGAGGIDVDSLRADIASTPQVSNIQFSLWQTDSIAANGAFELDIDSSITILLSQLNLEARGQDWSSRGPSRIVIADDNYYVDSLSLQSPSVSGGEDQRIIVDGLFSLSDSENLSIDISHLNMTTVGSLLELPYQLGGDHSLHLNITGTAAAPIIDGTGRITKGEVGQFAFDSLFGEIKYRDGHLSAAQTLVPSSAGRLQIQAALSMNLSLTDSTEILPKNAPMDVVVTADTMSLTVLQAFGQQIEHVTGFLDGRLAITNTINAPRLSGRMAVRNASFDMPRYGIKYSNMTLAMSFDSTQIRLDTLRVQRDNGLLTGSGELTLQNDVLSGMIRSSELRMNARNFYVVQYHDYEVQISGDAGLSGPPDAARYSGTITVDRSRVYLPALMKMSDGTNGVDAKGLPMLVRATRPDTTMSDTTRAAAQPEAVSDTLQQYAEYYENLRGSLKVKFPRNSWIRSPDMQIEIGGELDVVKEGREPELFGTINVKRGHYDLYGRRFNIKQGKLVFQGGTEYDPLVTLEATYTFRTAEREKKTLTLFVSGKASTPKISFQLDSQDISEGDAVAYLLFGRSLDQLSSGQKSQISSGSETDVAKRVAANFVSDKISQTIGKELNLDVIEIKAQDNLSAATFTVGKYLTSDLFVSYQRGIGSFEDQDIAREQVTLEYELTRFIYLQLIQGDSRESGADIILKYLYK